MQVMVYEFLVRDPTKGTLVRAPVKATREAIAILGGKIVPNTGERIDESMLDENGAVMSPKPQLDLGTR